MMTTSGFPPSISRNASSILLRFAAHLQVRFPADRRGKPLAYDGMVVHDQDSPSRHRHK